MRHGAFTLIELVAVVGMLGLLFLLLAPSLAHTGPNVRAVQCLSNLTRMQAGANMYPADFSDSLLPNAPVGSQNGWVVGVENWGTSFYNTNSACYLTNTLAPYVQYQIQLYKCPGDTIPSANGPRIRSYSMNGQMGILPSYHINVNSGWRTYNKVADLGGNLPPAKALIFCEESMYTLNDGYLQMGLSTPSWPDLPGSYHNGAMGVSFADGHVELHQWVDSYVQVPVRFGYSSNGGFISSTGADPDWLWTRDHAAAPQ